MPQTRRNRKTEKSDPQEFECIAMEDVNSDQSETAQPTKSVKQNCKRTKLEKSKLKSKASTSRQNEKNQETSAKFVEGEHVVDMNVDGDFASDEGSERKDECSSSDEGDRSDGEIGSSGNEMNMNNKNRASRIRENESRSRSRSRSGRSRSQLSEKSESTSESDESSFERHRSRRKKKRKLKKKKNRRMVLPMLSLR